MISNMFLRTYINNNFPVLNIIKKFSTTNVHFDDHSCKLLIVGGGAGGCTVAAKFANYIGKNNLIVVEPSKKHYYQPLFTLVGGGVKKLENSYKRTEAVLPSSAKWINSSVIEFRPNNNEVLLANYDTIKYDFMLIAIGLQLNYDKIPGLVEALNIPYSGVCSNYSPKYVNQTYETLQSFESGNAIFTFPNSPVKCPGAPQKVCYISDHYLRRVKKRDKANIIYNTSLPVIFGVKKYADALWKIVEKRDIIVNLRTNLIEIKPKEKTAVFQNLDDPEMKTNLEYSMLHVTPPMGPPDVLMKNPKLVNELGFVSVSKDTLQHTEYPNVFSIGDCSSTPNSKTAASVAVQSDIVYKNMKVVMEGKEPKAKYNGYASCPLITGYGSCILAEFDYDLNPMETFPISQDKELWLMYSMKRDLMPPLYWYFMLTGQWNGPGALRKIMHLNLKA